MFLSCQLHTWLCHTPCHGSRQCNRGHVNNSSEEFTSMSGLCEVTKIQCTQIECMTIALNSIQAIENPRWCMMSSSSSSVVLLCCFVVSAATDGLKLLHQYCCNIFHQKCTFMHPKAKIHSTQQSLSLNKLCLHLLYFN